jgi:hypothetical protein
MARLSGDDSRKSGSLSERVVDLLADRDAGERVHRLVRLLVFGAVLIVAMIACVLLVHPDVMGALVSAP